MLPINYLKTLGTNSDLVINFFFSS